MCSFRPVGDFYSPRHRHPTVHVRYIVSGTINYGEETYSAGDCIIVPEAVKYGPMQPGPGESPHFLQTTFMGPSGIPLPSQAEVEEATERLRESGVFADGSYIPHNGQPQDAFEAVSDNTLGQTSTTYPKTRVNTTLGFRTDAIRGVVSLQASQSSTSHISLSQGRT